MQYLLLLYEAEEIWENSDADTRSKIIAEHMSMQTRLQDQGVEFQGRPLMPTSTAVSLRVRNGKRDVVDGPFAETKEHLAGFYLVDVESVDAALEIAAQIPTSRLGTVEVRPIADHSGL